jgi:predicted permease
LSRRQKELAPNTDQVGVVVPLKADVVGGARSMLVIVMAAVGLLLLIACVNVASLFLSRGAARATELAVRSALGSPRRRLVRQLLAESLVLAMAGGLAGLVLAWAVSDALVLLAPAGLLPDAYTTLDARVFTFAFAAALLSGVFFGVVPALRFTRPGLESVLREGGRSGAAGRAEGRARSVLVVAEFSLALVLLIGAGVLIASFDRLRNVELNIEPDDVLTFETHLPFARYADAEARARFHVEFERRIARIPGVLAAGATSRLPGTGQYHRWGTRRVIGDGEGTFLGANQRVVEGDFFAALGIPLLSGRVFGPEDRVDATRAAVVNQSLARALFDDENPLGQRITTAGNELTIIGVVADVPIDARGEVAPKVYHSHTQFAADRNWALTQVVKLRDAASTSSVLASAARELAGIDAELVIYEPRALTDVIGRGVQQERFAMLLLAAFAALAVLLASVGIYGVLAYAVSRRRAEIGIRMALGATTSDVQRMIVGQGIRLAAFGILFGVAGALVLTRGLRSLVFGVSVTDPWIFLTCAAALTFIAVAASALPSFVATRVNPVESFRQG